MEPRRPGEGHSLTIKPCLASEGSRTAAGAGAEAPAADCLCRVQADREQVDQAAAQAISRMNQLVREPLPPAQTACVPLPCLIGR